MKIGDKKLPPIIVIILLLVFPCPAFPAIAQGGDIEFSARPANPAPGEPAMYFQYSLSPGETGADELMVINLSETAAEFKLYPADARTSRYGGAEFGEESDEREEVGSWITLSSSRLTLGPGESQTVQFTFSVPPDAQPGKYYGAVVVEAVEPITQPAEEAGQEREVLFNVIQRIAVSVSETVPGPLVTAFEITDVQQVWRGAQVGFDVALRNAGNTHLKNLEGALEVMDASGQLIGSFPIPLPFLLARDAIVFPINCEDILPPGRYSLAVSIDYGADEPATYEAEFEITPETVEEAVEEARERGFDVEAVTIVEGQAAGYWQYIALGLGFVLVLVALMGIFYLLIRRRRKA